MPCQGGRPGAAKGAAKAGAPALPRGRPGTAKRARLSVLLEPAKLSMAAALTLTVRPLLTVSGAQAVTRSCSTWLGSGLGLGLGFRSGLGLRLRLGLGLG